MSNGAFNRSTLVESTAAPMTVARRSLFASGSKKIRIIRDIRLVKIIRITRVIRLIKVYKDY